MQKILKIIIITLLIINIIIPSISGKNKIKIKNQFIIKIDPENPNPPIITGPTEGQLNKRYTYEIMSEDPQCDNICYTVICSDLPVIYHSDFCESGYTLIFNHSWDDFYQKEPPYTIRAKATDCKGHESEWSLIEISITRNINIQYQLSSKLLSMFTNLKLLI